MRKRKNLTAILTMVFSMFFGINSGFASEGLSLDIFEAATWVLENNTSINSIRQEAAKASATKLQADGNFTPSVALSGQYSRQDELYAPDKKDNLQGAITVTQQVYSGGRNQALKRQAKTGILLVDYQIEDAENNLLGNLFARFYNVLLQREQVTAAQEAVQTSQRHVTETRKRMELGLANYLEVVRAEQNLSSNEAALSAAQGALDAAQFDLMNLLNIPPEENRYVAGDIADSRFKVSGDKDLSLANAMENRKDLKVLALQMDQQEDQIKIAKSDMIPKVNLSGLMNITDAYNGQNKTEDVWRATLALDVPIYDRNQTRGNVLKARASLEQNALAYSQKELDIKSEVEVAWLELETARQRVVAMAKSLELAKETLRLSEVGYREGVTPQLDLLTAQTELVRARTDHAQALYQYLMTVVSVKQVEGVLIQWVEETER